MKWTILLAALLLAPTGMADHPGVEQGLALQDPLLANLVHRLPDVQSSFTAWETAYPEFVETMQIGASVTGLPLESIKITDESVPFDQSGLQNGEKIRVYLDGGHHGNEFLGVDIVMFYLESLLDNRDEAQMATFLATHEVYATPIVNPEGNSLDTRKNANQVDVNRNYGFMWGGGGSSDLIADLNYRGSAPFSEPEVQANAEFGRDIRPDLWITMHTGVAEFYWPWGWTSEPAPDAAFFETLEGPFENATNGRVAAMQSAELYIAAGATDDWAYAELGMPAFTYEVHEDQFVPVYGSAISSELEEQIAGLDFMVMNAEKIGGWADLHVIDGNFHVYNAGWGPMVNITVNAGGAMYEYAELAANKMIEFEGIPAEEIEVTYQSMRIATAPQRTSLFASTDIATTPEVQETPFMFPALALLAFALLRRLK